MQLMKSQIAAFSPLFEFAGTDQTRTAICDSIAVRNGRLYATDGHRLCSMKADPEWFKDGKIYSVGAMRKALILTELVGLTYPAVEEVIPKEEKFKFTVNWRAPEWLEKLNRSKRPAQVAVHMETGAIRLDAVAGEDFAGFNLYYLKPFAGKELRLRLIDRFSPIKVELVDDPETFAIIMPLRL